MKRIALAAVSILIAFSFAGCGAEPETGGQQSTSVIDHEKIAVDGDTDIHLYKVDVGGTLCVVSDGGGDEGGIDCLDEPANDFGGN